jgi:hypothetical protein
MGSKDSLSESFAVILKEYLSIEEISEGLHHSLSAERLGSEEDRLQFFIEYSLGFFISEKDKNRLIILCMDPKIDVDVLFDLMENVTKKTQKELNMLFLLGYFAMLRKVAKERRQASGY